MMENKSAENKLYDIAIIGSGPAGLSAAINAHARGKRIILISNTENYLNKAEQVNNYLGFFNISGKDLMRNFKNHIRDMNIDLIKSKVTNIMNFNNAFMINTVSGIINTKSVILATGVIQDKKYNGEDIFLGKGVSYCATCDGMLYRGKRVAVAGLSDDAFEEANFLDSIGIDVTFICDQFPSKEAAEHKNLILNDHIKYIFGKVSEISGNERVASVNIMLLESMKKNNPLLKIEIDGIFILREAISPASLIPGLEMSGPYIKVNKAMETNIPGLYAAGDCTGKPLQVAKAVGEGLIAALESVNFLAGGS